VAGVDPHTLISLTLQESGIGTAKKKASIVSGRHSRNTGTDFLGQVNDFSPLQEEEMGRLSSTSGISSDYLKPAIVLRDKLKYAERLGFKDDDLKLQAYNGYGKLLPQKDASGKSIPTKYYGIDVPEEGIDMRKTPLYGRRLIELKKSILNNKEINDLIAIK